MKCRQWKKLDVRLSNTVHRRGGAKFYQIGGASENPHRESSISERGKDRKVQEYRGGHDACGDTSVCCSAVSVCGHLFIMASFLLSLAFISEQGRGGGGIWQNGTGTALSSSAFQCDPRRNNLSLLSLLSTLLQCLFLGARRVRLEISPSKQLLQCSPISALYDVQF